MGQLQLDVTPDEIPVFLAETEEMLQLLDEQLVRLEREGSTPELLQEVFRAAHTIKGASGSIGHLRMARLTHAMETLLDLLRRGELGVHAAIIDRLLEALDLLRVLAAEVESMQESDVDVDNLIKELEMLAGSPPPAAQAAAAGAAVAAKPAPSGATHRVTIELQPTDWSAVRALQAVMALEQIGEIISSDPGRSDIERGQASGTLTITLRSSASVEAVNEALADVVEITVGGVEVFEDAEDAAAEEATAAATVAEEQQPALRLVESPAAPKEQRPAEAAAEPRATAQAGRKAVQKTANATVRVDIALLDELFNLVGELVIDRTRLTELTRSLSQQIGKNRALNDLGEATLHLTRVTEGLQSVVMKTRMLPIGTVFNKFPRMCRDLANRLGKNVELVIEGEDTELDRSVIEEVGDPLVHLFRNAIDHGVEGPADRTAAGKPEMATIRLAAEHVENCIVITVEDNGRGIDPAKVKAKAVERGILTAEAATHLSDHEATDLIFAPGFSTAAAVSDVSGRGVGMDIVRTNIEKLGGSVEVRSTPGKGSSFFLRLPLTLAIVQTLLVRVRETLYALPLTSVTETLKVDTRRIQRVQGQDAILLRGRVLPIVRLEVALGGEPTDRAEDSHVLVVAVKVGNRQVGLAVDTLLGEQEIVIKSLGPVVGDVAGISSAAILGDGTVALIVDIPVLVQRLGSDRTELALKAS